MRSWRALGACGYTGHVPTPGKHIAIVIDADLHRRAHIAAAYRGQKFRDWVEAAIETEVGRQEGERLKAEQRARKGR